MSKYPDWVLKHKRKGTAIHKIGNNYYLYKVTSVWDGNLRRARKVTESYLGVITKDGLIEPGQRRRPSSVKEYGASMFLLKENPEILEGLKKHFPYYFKELFVLSCLRLLHRSPLKNMSVFYEDSWLSEEIEGARLSDKFLSHLLEAIGGDRGSIVRFMRDSLSSNEGLLIDLTHVFSSSEGVNLRAKGYNSEFDFSPQVNLLFMFSLEKMTPLFYRVLPGNVRDVNSLKATIEESGIDDVIIIGDKGFYSKENVELLKGAQLRYILPLKRDNRLIDYGILESGDKSRFEGYFKQKERFIWYYRSGGVLIYLDERLRVEEEEDYLSRIESHPEDGYSVEGFHRSRKRFGSIALITNLEGVHPSKIYQYWKCRAEIEVMFDVYKNLLQADRTYMRSDKGMEAFVFINYLSLVYYYKIYKILLKGGLLDKYSVNDFLLHLSRMRRVKVGGRWIELEIPKQTRKLIEKAKLPIT